MSLINTSMMQGQQQVSATDRERPDESGARRSAQPRPRRGPEELTSNFRTMVTKRLYVFAHMNKPNICHRMLNPPRTSVLLKQGFLNKRGVNSGVGSILVDDNIQTWNTNSAALPGHSSDSTACHYLWAVMQHEFAWSFDQPDVCSMYLLNLCL